MRLNGPEAASRQAGLQLGDVEFEIEYLRYQGDKFAGFFDANIICRDPTRRWIISIPPSLTVVTSPGPSAATRSSALSFTPTEVSPQRSKEIVNALNVQ